MTTIFGTEDIVHLLVNYPPKVAVSKLVNSLKGVSSRLLRKKNYPSIRKKLWGGVLWSPSYFAGSFGGAPIEIIRPSSSRRHTDRPKDACGVRAILPRPEGRGLPRTGSPSPQVFP